MEPIRIPKQSTTKMPTNPNIDFDRLFDMSNQTLSMDMAPPVEQSQLDTAAGYRDLGSLAAALSGAVRGAGSVGGKLPNDFGFPQIARDLGNSRSIDLQNQMALRKQQENDMLEAIKNSGIAQQAKLAAERRAKPISEMDRKIASARLKQFDKNLPDLPPEMTYGDLESEPFLAQILGIDNGTSGMSEYQKASLEIQRLRAEQDAALRDRMLAIQGGKASTEIEGESRKTAIDHTASAIVRKIMKEKGHPPEDIPEYITREQATQEPYKSMLSGAFAPKKPEKDQKPGGAKPLTEAQIGTQRKQLRDTLAKEQIPNAVSIMGEIESILRKHPKDIPGIGSTSALPDAAIGVGASLGLADPDASKLRTLLKSRLNALLQQRAGSAVTASEFDRVASELAAGRFTTDQQFIDAFNNSKRALREMIKNTWGGFGQQIKKEYTTGYTNEDGIEIPGGVDYGKWMATDTDYVPGEIKKQKSPPKTGTQIPGNENIPKEALDKATDAYNGMMGNKAPAPPGGAPKEVRRLTKDGKTAIFDAETKRFIRYAD